MLNTPELLDLLDARGTIAPELLAKLRQLHENAPQEFTVRVILKWLINRGAINPQTAELMLQLAGESFADPSKKPGNDLGLAPLADDQRGGARTTAAPPTAKPVAPPTAPAVSSAGPADDLFNDAEFQHAAGLTENPALAERPGPSAPAPPAAKRNVWDSPLLLISGGALLLLCFAGVFLLWSLNRETGDSAFKLAEDDYRAGSYTQAIHKFDAYLEQFPSHDGASLARVHRGLAKLRQAVDGTSDWPRALQTARDVLAEISTEDQFSDAHAELAALLPTIAEGLAKQAVANPDAAKVTEARETLDMVRTYVFPPSLRPDQKMTDIEAELAVASRKLDQDKSLTEAVAAIQAAISLGRSDQGYELRRNLVKKYPELRDNDSLRTAVATISQAQRQAVKRVSEKQAAAKAEAESPVRASLTLARRLSGATDAKPGEPVFALVDGAAYALDSGTGNVLWRRFVGFDTSFVPRRVGPADAGDAIVVDSVRNELLRVTSAGAIRWRAAIGEPFDAQPAVLRDKALVATRGGKLVAVELNTGEVTGHVLFPQLLRVAPATDSREKLHYQLGDHSNLFVLSAADGTCQEVYYLGHEPDRIRVPPVLVGRYVLVAENRFAENGILHVLKTDESGVGLKTVQEIPYVGHVYAGPEVAGRTVFLATDRGALSMWEVSTAEEGPVLTKILEKPADATAPPMVPFTLLRGGRLWIASQGLSQFEIQTSRGRLAPFWTHGRDDVFLHAPQPVGANTIVAVRRRAELPGAVVSAVHVDDGKPAWETEIGAPAVVLDYKDKNNERLAAFTLTGALYRVAEADVEGHKIKTSPDASEPVTAPLDAIGVRVDGDKWAFAFANLANAKAKQQLLQVFCVDNILSWKHLPDQLSGRPAVMNDSFLVPCRVGQVFQVAKGHVAAFQPRLESGVDYHWSPPLPLSNTEFLIADGRTKLYRVGRVDQPAPHLEAKAEATLQSPIVSPIAVLRNTAYAADAAGNLLSFTLPDLAPGKDWALGGPLTWGPERLGQLVMVSSQKGDLLAFDGADQLRWEIMLDHGPLAGSPLEARGFEIVLATTSGTIYTIESDTGRERAKIDVGQPLLGAMREYQGKLLVTTRDGTLLVVKRPD